MTIAYTNVIVAVSVLSRVSSILANTRPAGVIIRVRAETDDVFSISLPVQHSVNHAQTSFMLRYF